MARRLAACFFLSAAFAPSAFADERIIMVYRADSRPPEQVFPSGFSGRGSRMDLLAHTLGGACDETDPARASVWVSTSSELDEATGFARGHLEGLPPGPQNAMWIYYIRPDATYTVVSSILERVSDMAMASQGGYTPEQGRVLAHLLRNTVIDNEAEVVTHFVAPRNIAYARPVFFDQNDVLQIGAVAENSRYRDLDTEASRTVSDLQAFVPAASIRLGLLEDDGASSGSDSDQCAMQCDRAMTSSSFAAFSAAPKPVCELRKRASPAVLDVILGY